MVGTNNGLLCHLADGSAAFAVTIQGPNQMADSGCFLAVLVVRAEAMPCQAQAGCPVGCGVRATGWGPQLKANSVPPKAEHFPHQHSIRENCPHTPKWREQYAYQPATSHQCMVILVSSTYLKLPPSELFWCQS